MLNHQLNDKWICQMVIGTLTAVSLTAGSAIAIGEPVSVPVSRATSSLTDLVNLLKRDEPPLGSRSSLCPIGPGLLGQTDTIWSDRPVFMWQGSASDLILRTLNGQEPVWSQPLADTDQVVLYTGQALQPGQIYQWELSGGSLGNYEYVFEVMGSDARDRITRDLQTLEEPLKATGASPEAIDIERARYFANQGLWSDALQELRSVANPSAELTQHIEEMSTYLCRGGAMTTENRVTP